MFDARSASRLADLEDVSLNLRLRKNGVVEIDGRNHLFARLLDDGRFAFDDEENAKRKTLRESEFLDRYRAGRIVVRDWSVLPVKFRKEAERSLETLPPEKTTKAEWRHAYCVAFDANPVVKTERGLVPLIDHVAAENGHDLKPDWRTLLTWLRTRGVGGRRPLRAMRSFEELRGRKKGVDPEAENIIQDCIKLVFLNQQQLPASAVIEAVVGEIARRNEDLESAERIATPSPMTIHRRIAEHPFYRTLRLRIGKRAADQMMKPLKVAPETTRPLETIIIDHTKIDDWMLFEDQTSLPCGGRPWLTMAIDAYSRYPVGYYIGFEPPSVYSVMMCLQQAVAPKTDLFAKYKGIKADWRAAGLPLKLVADNAKEVVGLSLPRACAELGIELETSPVRTPKYKGIIERFFRTLNTTFLHRLPGTTYGNPKKLRDSDIDPRKTMSMSFDTFQFLFLKWLTQDYCKAKNRTIGCTPEKRWIEGTEKHRIQMPERISDLKVVLSRHADGMLSRSGLRYQNLVYRNSSTVSSVLEAAGKTKLRVKFRFDPIDIGTIYILHPSGTYMPLHCEDEYAKGISLWQHKIIQDENRKRDRDPKSYEDLMRTRLELMEAVHEAIQTGLAKSYEARFRGIGSQRRAPGSIPMIEIKTSSSPVGSVITVPTMAAPAFETADTPINGPAKSAKEEQHEKSATKADPKPPKVPVIRSSLANEVPASAQSAPEDDDLDLLLSNRFSSTSWSIVSD